MDTKEEYFIELILSRHARKLLTATCLRDLGKFAAHLDFNLEKWFMKERYNEVAPLLAFSCNNAHDCLMQI